jgi:acylphosphatase
MAKRLLIEGLVQGVGYRYAFAERATALGLSGWVRNRRDGTVEASVHGAVHAIDEAVAWAHKGPGAARVTQVHVRDEDEAAPAAAGVEIRPTV